MTVPQRVHAFLGRTSRRFGCNRRDLAAIEAEIAKRPVVELTKHPVGDGLATALNIGVECQSREPSDCADRGDEGCSDARRPAWRVARGRIDTMHRHRCTA